jgi:hypothetical protein
MRRLLIIILWVAGGTPLAAQELARDSLRGRVVGPAGAPVRDANVYAAGSLEGTITGPGGTFLLRGLPRGPVDVVVEAVGFGIVRRRFVVPADDTVRIVLGEAVVALEGITVEAGRHTAGSERGATLTSLDVVSIPGARGDVARAFQTLPGVQGVDEGSGMFVRGGDAQETRVFLNGAALLDPQRVETPVGSTSTSVDPFLLEGIFFSTGGFGARFGGALSAVADLRTAGIPAVARRSTVHASLASLSGRTSHRIGKRIGVHATANASDNRANFAINGSTRRYPEPPHGHALSGSALWGYRDRGELRLFTFDRASRLRVASSQAGYAGVSEQRQAHRLAILSWSHEAGSLELDGSGSWQRFGKEERFGALDLSSTHEILQLSAGAASELSSRLTLRGGVAVEEQRAGFHGTLAAQADRADPALPARALDAEVEGEHAAAWGEVEARPLASLRVTAGMRGGHSGWTGSHGWEPRLSATYLAAGDVLLVAAAGAYTQLPDPLIFALAGLAERPASPMRGRQVIAGASRGTAERMVRLEVYHKWYEELAQLRRDYGVSTGGEGRSRGADLFALTTLPGETSVRLVYSLVDSERTDPDSGILAPSSADVTHTLLTVVERTWLDRLRLGAAYRGATGRPFTPVVGADERAPGVWEPRYGAPFGDRLPAFGRLDLSASLLHGFTPDALGVVYVSVYNVLARRNVLRYAYSADYTRRTPVLGQLGRGIFFGASLTF